MQVDELGQLADRLVHEHAAAMRGRVDRVGRDEEDGKPLRRGGQRDEAVPIVAGVVALECFHVVEHGVGAGA